MAKDIKVRAILDDKITGELARLSASLKGFQSISVKGVSDVLASAQQQTAQILQKTGGTGLLGQAMFGAGAAGGAAGLSKAMEQYKRKLAALKAPAGGLVSLPTHPVVSSILARGTGGAEQVNRALGNQSDLLIKARAGWLAVSAAIAGAAVTVAGFNKAMSDAARYAKDIYSSAERLGISVETYQELSYAAKQLNVDIGSLTGAYRILSNEAVQAVTGNKDAARTFKALGISIDPKNMPDPTQLFEQVIGKLHDINNVTVRNALAQRTLGRSYMELVPLMNAGATGMAALRKEAIAIGAVMGEQQVNKLSALADAYDKAGAAMKGAMNKIAEGQIGFVSRFLAGITDLAPKIGKIFGGIASFMAKAIESALRVSLIYIPEALFGIVSVVGVSIGAALGSGITEGLRGSLELIQQTLGRMLPEGFNEMLQKAQDKLHSGTKAMWEGVQKIIKGQMDLAKLDVYELFEIWEKGTITKETNKSVTSLDELLDLLKKLNTEDKKGVDIIQIWLKGLNTLAEAQVDVDKKAIDSMEKRIEMIDKLITTQETLFDLSAKQAGMYSPLEEALLRVRHEFEKLSQDVYLAYTNGLITHQQYIDGIAAASEMSIVKQEAAAMESLSTGIDYGQQLFESISGLMAQMTENQMKDIDKWQAREEKRVERSIMTEGQKEAAMARIDAQAEARRKREFEKMKALKIAEATINTAAGVVQELGKEGVYGIITGAIVLAAGLIQVATIAAETYAQGGVVPGQQMAGDRRMARVNSGEMVLTKEQQAQLFSMANGASGGSRVTISAPITIGGDADASTVAALKGTQEKQLEKLRGMIMELEYRGRL